MTADAGKVVDKEEHLPIVGYKMVQDGTSTLEISLVVPQKIAILLPEDPAIPLLGIYPKFPPPYNKDTCSTMFIAALFIITRSWKEPRCP